MSQDRISYREYLLDHRYSLRSIRTYLFLIDKISRNLDFKKCCYREILIAISCRNFSSRYRRVIVAALKQYFYYLMETGNRLSHPCRNLQIRSNFTKQFIQSDFLTHDELHLLKNRTQRYGILELRDGVLFSLLTTQGLCAEEIANLQLKHIDLKHEMIVIPQSRKYTRRKLALVKGQVAILHEYMNRIRPKLIRNETNSLLIGKCGTALTPDSIQYLVGQLQHLIPDKKLSPTFIRQSVIVWWINGLKIPLEQVQLMCGHRWISATQRYQFHSLELDLKMVNRWL